MHDSRYAFLHVTQRTPRTNPRLDGALDHAAKATGQSGGFVLTPQQQRAINLMPQHNLQIIACAGSGKTEIVSRGISEIIKRGVSPSEIVAFTFTEKAAEELKARVRVSLEREGGPERFGRRHVCGNNSLVLL